MKTVVYTLVILIFFVSCVSNMVEPGSLPTGTGSSSSGYDLNDLPVPADAGTGLEWELQEELSDDFKYTFTPTMSLTDFGNGKWYNFYHNSWDGPGTTYWQYEKVCVDGESLLITTSRSSSSSKMSQPGIDSGCVTSNNQVLYPVFIEACISVADIALASDIWLLSSDDTQEIDIIECYGGAYNDNDYFAELIHLSHHSFIRSPFTDYQPKDMHSWWKRSGVDSWGSYCWNDGSRTFVRVGLNWISPFHFEYYIDGELVRVLYHNAFATKVNGNWYYTYPTMSSGELDFNNGYQDVETYAIENGVFSFDTLQAASSVSQVSVIDPYGYQNEEGFTKPMDIIINMESQNWHVSAGRTPDDAQLADPSHNTMKVDWIRVYKPF